MICAPAAGRPAFRVGVWDRNGRKHREDGADDHISEKGRAKSLSFWREEPRRGSPEGESSMSLRHWGLPTELQFRGALPGLRRDLRGSNRGIVMAHFTYEFTSGENRLGTAR
jgi:hypothetical protein